ncbi:MAG: hypothetical protein LBM69_06030 [Lachnospiraceae bacterium]|nr:hypothetical protein [Lachnospiraceae bacterium]
MAPKAQSPKAATSTEIEKRKLEEEKRKLKVDRAQTKKRAKEIAKQESALSEEENKGNGVITFFATVFIVAVWLAVMVIVVKLDVGGFGSNVLAPIIGDIPVLNRILPEGTSTSDPSANVDISQLQRENELLKQQLSAAQSSAGTTTQQIEELRAEVNRLRQFEDKQVEFQRIQTQFYEEVIYAQNGPGPEAYREYFEEMDEETAQFLYKQVVEQDAIDATLQDFVDTYAKMDPEQAAAIFEEMTDNMSLVADILNAMSPEERGSILAEMLPANAARLTKLLDPVS